MMTECAPTRGAPQPVNKERAVISDRVAENDSINRWRDVPDRRLVELCRAARKDNTLAVLEGLHPLKHALRFGARLLIVLTDDLETVERLCDMLAPDVWPRVQAQARIVNTALFSQLAPVPPDTRILAIAARPPVSGEELLLSPRRAPLIVLEQPTHLGNMGAVVRVAAAAGAAGVVTTGRHDPWHADALRGGRGLQFALPVARAEKLTHWRGPLLAVHPDGDPLAPGLIPDDAILVFGSERRGLSTEVLARADARVAIPMEAGVSSLNLATSVAIVTYAWRLSRG